MISDWPWQRLTLALRPIYCYIFSQRICNFTQHFKAQTVRAANPHAWGEGWGLSLMHQGSSSPQWVLPSGCAVTTKHISDMHLTAWFSECCGQLVCSLVSIVAAPSPAGWVATQSVVLGCLFPAEWARWPRQEVPPRSANPCRMETLLLLWNTEQLFTYTLPTSPKHQDGQCFSGAALWCSVRQHRHTPLSMSPLLSLRSLGSLHAVSKHLLEWVHQYLAPPLGSSPGQQLMRRVGAALPRYFRRRTPCCARCTAAGGCRWLLAPSVWRLLAMGRSALQDLCCPRRMAGRSPACLWCWHGAL